MSREAHWEGSRWAETKRQARWASGAKHSAWKERPVQRPRVLRARGRAPGAGAASAKERHAHEGGEETTEKEEQTDCEAL